MRPLLKMLKKNEFEFSNQTPLIDLQLSMSTAFPTILAMQRYNMDRAMYTQMYESEQAWKTTKAYFSSSERKSKGDNRATKTYALVYFNPETKKAEVIEKTISLHYENTAQRVLEEAVAQRSAYEIYSHVATPIIRQHVDQALLEEILNKIKIESPDPFGGEVGVGITSKNISPALMSEYGEKIIAFQIAEKKRKKIEEEVLKQILVVDETIKNLEHPHHKIKNLISLLPPLTRERVLALYKKKKCTTRKEIHDFLLKDLIFLKAVKQKICALRVQDIVKIILKIKNKTA